MKKQNQDLKLGQPDTIDPLGLCYGRRHPVWSLVLQSDPLINDFEWLRKSLMSIKWKDDNDIFGRMLVPLTIIPTIG